MAEVADTKVCTRCNGARPLSEFRTFMRDGKRVRHSWCNACDLERSRSYYTKHREKVLKRQAKRSKERHRQRPDETRAERLKSRHGITAKQYGELLKKQEGVCAICGGPPDGRSHFDVDHCHKTGAIRGLLCGPCNRGLGSFKDDAARLRSAADYLQKENR